MAYNNVSGYLPTLLYRDKSKHVAIMQRLINGRLQGEPIPVDSYYGDKTKNAVNEVFNNGGARIGIPQWMNLLGMDDHDPSLKPVNQV